MSDNDEKGDQPRTGFWITVSIGLLLAYFLSTGPVSWLMIHGYLGVDGTHPFFKTIYFPLEWLLHSSDLYRDLYVWYLRLWGLEVG